MRDVARTVKLCLALALSAPDLAAQAEPQGAEDTKVLCIAQHEKAQVLLATSRLKAAREALRVCSEERCPAAVRSDCLPWLADVARSVPSVIVRAKVDGAVTTDVRVLIDGAQIAATLDGKPIELDPGFHKFRFEHQGAAASEQDLLLNAGQLNRLLLVEFTTLAPKPAPSIPPPRSPRLAPVEPVLRRPVPVLAYVLGGVSVVGAGAFAGLGLAGMDERADLDASCRPGCSSDEVGRVRTKFLLADLSLGVAVASALGASYVYFTRPVEPEPAESERARGSWRTLPSVHVTLSAAGARFGMRGTF